METIRKIQITFGDNNMNYNRVKNTNYSFGDYGGRKVLVKNLHVANRQKLSTVNYVEL